MCKSVLSVCLPACWLVSHSLCLSPQLLIVFDTSKQTFNIYFCDFLMGRGKMWHHQPLCFFSFKPPTPSPPSIFVVFSLSRWIIFIILNIEVSWNISTKGVYFISPTWHVKPLYTHLTQRWAVIKTDERSRSFLRVWSSLSYSIYFLVLSVILFCPSVNLRSYTIVHLLDCQ